MYASLQSHLSMNSDVHRNSLYGKAIQQWIGGDDVVMDLGAGLGILGFLAARRGAAVHFVEPEQLLEIPRQVARINGFEQCQFHRSKVEDLPPLGPVDVIISVFTGNFLLTEDLLPSLFMARDRFLAPGGRLIPHCARMVVQPVSCADYYKKNIEQYTIAKAGDITIDYRLLRQYLVNNLYYDYFSDIEYEPLGSSEYFHELDFYQATSTACDDGVVTRIDQAGTCHGWIGWFDMGLGDDWLSTSPKSAKTHWRQVFLPLQTPLDVVPGEELAFHLLRPERGDWTWTTRRGGHFQRLSTFNSGPVDIELLRKHGNQNKPLLNSRGEAARWVLERFNGSMTLDDIAHAVVLRNPELFPGREEALHWIKGLVNRFT